MNPTPSTSTTMPPDRTKYFYTGAAILLLVLTFLGFQHFYLHGKAFPGRPLTPPIRTILIAHGVAMSAWIILLVIQPLLIANNKYRLHMTLGKIGAVLAACTTVLGYRVAVSAVAVNPPEMKLWGLVPKQFLIVPLSAIVMFAGYVAIGVWNRQRPEIHKPMMLFGTLTASAAAIDRIPFITQLYTGTVLGSIWGPYFAPVFIGAALLFLKWGLTRTFDRTFAIAFAVLTVIGALAMKLAPTQAWDSVAGVLLR